MTTIKISFANILALLLLVVLLFGSCSQDSDLDNLSDTVFLRNKNADMPAYIYGNGSEKVFLITLNGGPGGVGLGVRSTVFKDQIEPQYAVVYLDQRGSGMSQGSYTDNEVSIDVMAEDVLALVKVLKKKYGDDSRFFLLGHSWGGTLGTATLLKNEHDFLGWIEVAGAHNPSGIYFEYFLNHDRIANEQIALGNSIEYWENVKTLVLESNSTAYDLEDFLNLNSEGFDAEVTLGEDGFIAEEVGEPDAVFNYNPITASWNSGTIASILIDQGLFEQTNYTNRLPEITIPSLFLWGRYDMIVPPAFGQQAFDTIGSARKELVIFERSGHSPMLSESDLFAEKVLLFIDQNK